MRFHEFNLRLRIKLHKLDYTPLLLIWAVTVFYAFFCLYFGRSLAGSSSFSTYTLQALAWRNGRISLGQDYPWLELAIYNNDWFVSFPPVPSIPLYFLSFFFNHQTPDHLLVKLYTLIGCLAVYHMLRNAHYDKPASAGFALLCSFASCLLSLTTEGAVWYQAQTLAFALTCLSLMLMVARKQTLSLFLYALAVGCRPFNVLYGPVLFVIYAYDIYQRRIPWRSAIKRIMPGICLGLAVAAAYAWYNYVRFDDIFEFGHNYLPEFSTQGGTQFSLSHVWKNVKTFIFTPPYEHGKLRTFGFSFLLANPIFSLMIVWIVRDLFRKKLSFVNVIAVFCMLLHLFLLLLHRTFGGYQFGARYTCDLLPYAAVYLTFSAHKHSIHPLEIAILVTSSVFSVYGAAMTLL